MANRKPIKTGICTKDLDTPITNINTLLNRCEHICEHYYYCNYVYEWNKKLSEVD